MYVCLVEVPKNIFLSSLFCLIWAKGLKPFFFPSMPLTVGRETWSLKYCFYPINVSYVGNKYKVEEEERCTFSLCLSHLDCMVVEFT